MALVFRPARKSLGHARSRQRVEDGQPITLETRVVALPERRRAGQSQQMRQEVRHLVHQVDPELVVFDTDVHVHSADHETPRCRLHLHGECLIAVLLGLLLLPPPGERMRGGGDRREIVLGRDLDDAGSEPLEFRLGFLHVTTNTGADFDLRAQQLGRHLLAQQLFGFAHEFRGRIDNQRAGLFVDQQVFFFDAERERRSPFSHGLLPLDCVPLQALILCPFRPSLSGTFLMISCMTPAILATPRLSPIRSWRISMPTQGRSLASP